MHGSGVPRRLPVRSLSVLVLAAGLAVVGCGPEDPAGSAADGTVARAAAIEKAAEGLRAPTAARRLASLKEIAKDPGLAKALVPGVAALLADDNRWVRQAAADALYQAGDAALPAVDALARALLDTDSFVRWRSAKVLARLGPAASAALPALEAEASAPDETALGHYWSTEAVRRIRGVPEKGQEDLPR